METTTSKLTAAQFQYAMELSHLTWAQMTASQQRHAAYFEAEIAGLKWARA